MTAPSRQIGESPQARLLRYILKQLERLTAIASKISTNPSLILTSDEVDAIQNSASPSSTNVFATMADISTTSQYTQYIDILDPTLKWRDGLLLINHPDTGVPTVMWATTKELIPNGFSGDENMGWEVVKYYY